MQPTTSERSEAVQVSGPPPPAPPQKKGWPAYVWVLLGMGLAGAGMKVIDAIQGRSKSMQQQMMEQMLKTATQQQQQSPGQGQSPFPPPPPPPPQQGQQQAAAMDTTATAAPGSPSPSPSPSIESTPGQEGQGEAQGAQATQAPPPPPPGTEASQGASASQETGEKKRGSYFKDPEVVEGQQAQTGEGEQGGGFQGQGAFTLEMLERMLDDPQLQPMLMPYLPEGMKDPNQLKELMKNPAYREQLQQMLDQMGDQGMPDGMQFPGGQEGSMQQFEQMGIKPEELMRQIMADPELSEAFKNPRIQTAIMECSKNPMNMSKYQDDPEVMKVFMKMSQLLPNNGGAFESFGQQQSSQGGGGGG